MFVMYSLIVVTMLGVVFETAHNSRCTELTHIAVLRQAFQGVTLSFHLSEYQFSKNRTQIFYFHTTLCVTEAALEVRCADDMPEVYKISMVRMSLLTDEIPNVRV